MRSIAFPIQELIIARFDRGDDLLKSIKQVVEEHAVTAGMFSVIGAVDRAQWGYYLPDKRTYSSSSWKPKKVGPQALEILACLGNVALLDNEPVIHGHITLKGETDRTFGGHLMEGCRINPTGELTLIKAKGVLNRRWDQLLNLALLVL